MASRFRPKHRALTVSEAELVEEIKTQAEHLAVAIDQAPVSRERSLAMTKLEEAVMWAVKGVTA
jgi:sulfur carrier protein ThiS